MTTFWLHWYFYLMFLLALFFFSYAVSLAIRKKNPSIILNMRAIAKNLTISVIQQAPKFAKLIFGLVLGSVIGYQYRDITAYHEFTERNPANWTVTAQYPAHNYPGMAYDILLADNKTKIPEFTPCEDPGLRVGMRIIRTGYYVKPNCVSFRGPRAYIVKEH